MRKHDGLSLMCLGLVACGLAACDGSDGAMPRPPEAAPTIERPDQIETVAPAPGVDPLALDGSERKRPLVAVTSCNLERLNGQAFSAAAGELPAGVNQMRLSGWVADVQRGGVPQVVEIRLDSVTSSEVWGVSTDVAVKREDVQTLLDGGEAFERPGFLAVINTDHLAPGAYRAYLVFADGDELKVCDNGRRILLP